MPLLLYCIVEAELPVSAPAAGVQQAAVYETTESGLRCLYSPVDSLTSDAASIKQAALDFHKVVSEIFEQATVIPFRFPTLVADIAELTSHLSDNAAKYSEALHRLRGLAQMEVVISAAPSEPSRASGTQYLRDRQEQQAALRGVAASVRSKTQNVPKGWRERETNRGWRCYALLSKPQASQFAEMVRCMKAPAGLQLRVTGPWPATEFIEIK